MRNAAKILVTVLVAGGALWGAASNIEWDGADARDSNGWVASTFLIGGAIAITLLWVS